MIGMNFKQVFSGSKAKVGISAADRASGKVLRKFGSFVRRTAMQSIKRRKGISQPGSPPRSHTGALKQSIGFWHNPQARNVIIGPQINRAVKSRAFDVPRVLEEGGQAYRYYVRRKRRGRRRRIVITGSAFIKARPYMGPAFRENLPKLPQMWQDSITK